ncbi:hypothetical protein [Kitasatospora griseola]|uniref:hypothetical protein n=1 Tax=Kitasatospora griseola TaxID=2064 RepID=UPI003805A757
MAARIRIRSAHEDGTRCTHRTALTGAPLEPDCTGRNHYTAECSYCSGTAREPDLDVLRRRIQAHLDTHVATSTARLVTDVHLPD